MSPRGRPVPVDPADGVGTLGPTAPPLSDGDLAREREVRRRLAEAADGAGYIRSDRFIELSLYAPDAGFYARPDAALGPRGDFYTAAHVTPLFGRTIARRIAREHERLRRPSRWTVVELGAGDGTLAAAVIGGLIGELGDRTETAYTIVERSPSLRREALARAESAAADSPVRVDWTETLGSLGPFRGFVLANELLDAMPFRRFVRRSGGWRELGVRFRGEVLEWVEGTEPRVSGLEPLPGASEGTQVELCAAAEALPREVADHLRDGAAVFIDYGGEERALVEGRPSGTMAAVRHHRPVSDVLEHPGLDDLSAFVNFTRVRRAARSAGLAETAYRPMREALIDWGIESVLETDVKAGGQAEKEVRSRLAVKNLLLGFDTFQVLELGPPPAR